MTVHLLQRWIAMILVIGAAAGCSSAPQTIADSEREAIVQEIRKTLDDYYDACMRKDLNSIERFWSAAKEFVFAGDGVILGGRKEWSERLKAYDQETEKWTKFAYRNVHVAVLAGDAASATLEFETSRHLKDGTSANVKGSWTYVFKKYGDRWRVIQSNGTHVAF